MIAAERHIDGPAGFYLATDEGDAQYFAVRRSPGAIIVFEVDDEVIGTLLELGAVRRPIPGSPMSPSFAGDELYIPTSCFDAFNAARRQERIRVHAN